MGRMPTTDEELLARARDGDRRAVGELLERHQGRVYRFGMKMCGEPEDAKDVLQETLLAAARGLPEFRGASSVTTWLYAIARSFCIKKRRTSKFAPEVVESLEDRAGSAGDVADAARGPDEQLSGQEVQRHLQEAIGALDPMYREVLILRDVEGLTAAEVAEVLGLTVEAVKSRLHRARVAVRARVAPFLGIPRAEGQSPPTSGCPDVLDFFSRKLEGEISGSVCEELEAHLRRCPRCSARCDSLRASLALCKRAGEEAVPPRIELSVRTALRKFLEALA
jgi:RNA polymerase sigma-70 factor (ECF subfamily)